MKLNKLYSESISHLRAETQEWLMTEHPHGHLNTPVPPALINLANAHVDWGFENLGLPEEQYKEIYRSIRRSGVVLHKTGGYKLRETPESRYVIEPTDGTEALTLPDNWRKAIVAMYYDPDRYVWIGKLVRQDQIGSFDRTTLPENEEGYGRLA